MPKKMKIAAGIPMDPKTEAETKPVSSWEETCTLRAHASDRIYFKSAEKAGVPYLRAIMKTEATFSEANRMQVLAR